MGVQKQSVSFTDAAYASAKASLEHGDCPNVIAAASGELARARASREREQALLEAEVRRRLEMPVDHWVPLGNLDELTAGAFARVDALERKTEGQAID